ncbi:hypothetical protein QBC43DRAFT_306488 [Cladorrhinum sp. PSN259]|nr:hypothetical protein QBC43DRAFT_306488 [Cladorrhinum sp. PSN259]
MSILDVIQRKQEVWDHVHTSLRPWTQIFSTTEPPDLDDTPYPATSETRFIAFIQTLTAGYSGYEKEEFVEFVQKYRLLMYNDAKNDPLSEFRMNSGSHINQQLMYTDPNSKINERLKGLLRKRRFAVTQTGFFALVPIQAAPGDVIAVLVGGAVPFVLRKKVVPDTSGENDQVNASLSGASATGNTDSKNTPPSDTSNEIEFATAEVWHEINGPKYAGTSRSPDSPLIVEHTLHLDETGESTLGVTVRFKAPTKLVGIDDKVYDPLGQVIGTAYVHGIMHGEMKERYKAGDAALQTFLLV